MSAPPMPAVQVTGLRKSFRVGGDTIEAVREADIVAVLVAHAPFRKIPREELMRRMVIDVTGLTHEPG